MKSYIVALTLSLSLAAGCGKSLEPEAEYDNRVSKAHAMLDRLSTVSNTAWPAMPTTGNASFRGHTEIFIGATGDETDLIGKAQVDVDFGTNLIEGVLDEFVGSNSEGEFDKYAGTIALHSGFIGDVDPNDFIVDYDGNLSGNGDDILIAGTIEGRFIGTPIRGLKGVDASPLVLLNGDSKVGFVGLVAEKR